MALARTQLPFVKQSLMRQLRSGAFRSKQQVGPQTTEAITRGTLEADRQTAMKQAAQEGQLAQQEKIHEETLAENARQADMRNKIQERQLSQDQANRDRQAQADRRRRKREEKNFFDGIMGS